MLRSFSRSIRGLLKKVGRRKLDSRMRLLLELEERLDRYQCDSIRKAHWFAKGTFLGDEILVEFFLGENTQEHIVLEQDGNRFEVLSNLKPDSSREEILETLVPFILCLPA